MNPLYYAWLYLAVIVALAALLFLFQKSAQKTRENNKKLIELWHKLNNDALEVSLLVSRHCPSDEVAHRAVLDAAQCLVFPNVGARTIVSAGMITARYQKGFAHLETARKLALPK